MEMLGSGPVSALCNLLWNARERGWTLLLSALGVVPSGMLKGNRVPRRHSFMVVSPELSFLATLCPLLSPGVGRERNWELGNKAPLWVSRAALFTVTALASVFSD